MNPPITRRILNKIFLSGAQRLLRPTGYAIVQVEAARPCAWGSRPILGSFPPLAEGSSVGNRQNYFVHDGYRHRDQAVYFDDTQNTDQSQLEVYEFAKEICDRERLSTIYDIGCGSGYKLIKYFRDRQTVGIDLPKTCDWLNRKYPGRIWRDPDSLAGSDTRVDMVIASDVIEHVEDPDQLMVTIQRLRSRYVVLSTPDRDLLRVGTHNGPPLNPAHVREWSFMEFEVYVSEYFRVLEHFVSCAPQATQCLLCQPENEPAEVPGASSSGGF